MDPDVSIIIPAKNEAANIGRCLDAVFGQKTRRSIEVIVIDSGSTDQTAQIAARRPVKIIKIRPEQFDHGGTRNMGFESSSGKYLVALVADATPANDRWLEELIAPLDADPDIAGAYSRQVPPPNFHPLASARFAGLDPSRLEPGVRSWPGDGAWEKMSPQEKLKLVEFDDVSSVRRRSVWEKIPVAENYWAEDVDWSLKALRAGYKIAYCSESVVQHGHRPSLRHDFKRAFVDQREASGRFGIVLYANAREAFDSWLRIVGRDLQAIKDGNMAGGSKIYWTLISPVRRFLEVLGGYLAGKPQAQENTVRDLYSGFILTSRRGDVRKTVFSLGDKRCNTVFAHPPSSWSFKARIRAGSSLEFLAGIHPDAHDKVAPVQFIVAVNDETVWNCELDPANRAEDRQWRRGEVDIASREGRRVRVSMITKAENAQNAWAGWGEPRLTADRGAIFHRIGRKFGELVERLITRTPPRHP